MEPKAYRARIESLLNESSDERLAGVWRRVYPLPVDLDGKLPDRRGIIVDLADFAEVLQPNLDGMPAHRLCGLVEKYASCGPRQSDLSVFLLARQAGMPQCRAPRKSCHSGHGNPL